MPQAPARLRRRPRDWQPRAIRPVPTGSRSWDDAVGAFLRHARARKCSPATLVGLHRLSDRAEHTSVLEDYGIRSVSDVTPDKIRKGLREGRSTLGSIRPVEIGHKWGRV